MDSTLEIEAVGMVSPRGEAGYLSACHPPAGSLFNPQQKPAYPKLKRRMMVASELIIIILGIICAAANMILRIVNGGDWLGWLCAICMSMNCLIRIVITLEMDSGGGAQ